MAVMAVVLGGPWYSGNGSGSVAHGSLWDNLPSSDNITQFDLTNIILDETLMNSVLDYDYIVIQVTDIDGNWWRAQVNFDNGPKIINIDVKA